jgi:hypothetical protein
VVFVLFVVNDLCKEWFNSQSVTWVRTSHQPHSMSVGEEVRRIEEGCRSAPMPFAEALEAEQNLGDAAGSLWDAVRQGHAH